MIRTLRAPLLLLMAAALGCANGDPVAPVDDSIPTDVTTPAAALESHNRALEQRNADAYVALLEKTQPGNPFTGFRFYFRAADADHMHWLVGDSWDRETEAALIRNLTDPRFAGDAEPVQGLDVSTRIMEERILADRVELTVDAAITAFVGTDLPGWLSDTRFVYTLVRDDTGYYRIRSIREEALTPFRDEPGVEVASWGRVKAAYHRPADVPTNLTDVGAVIESHARSIEAKNLAAYAALLTPDFGFFPRDDDLVDFPWLPGNSWGLDEELRIMGHMMDPHYVGAELPVRSMQFEYVIIDQRIILDPNQNVVGIEVRADADVTVLVASDNGWFADTRFIFLLVKDANGYYRIRSIREIQVLEPLASVESSSFGEIRGLYR